MRTSLRSISTALTFALLLVSGCSTSDDAAQPCNTVSDCQGNEVCLAYGQGPATCLPTCTAEVNSCGGEATCQGVGSVSVDVCQPPKDPEEPADPEEEPRIPCTSDEECSSIAAGAICAQFQGARDCTRPCSSEAQCDVPTVGGVTVDFLTCIPDEGDPSRTACLPDVACFADPLSCTDFDDPLDTTGFDTGFDDTGFDDTGTEETTGFDDDGFDTGFDDGFDTGFDSTTG